MNNDKFRKETKVEINDVIGLLEYLRAGFVCNGCNEKIEHKLMYGFSDNKLIFCHDNSTPDYEKGCAKRYNDNGKENYSWRVILEKDMKEIIENVVLIATGLDIEKKIEELSGGMQGGGKREEDLKMYKEVRNISGKIFGHGG